MSAAVAENEIEIDEAKSAPTVLSNEELKKKVDTLLAQAQAAKPAVTQNTDDEIDPIEIFAKIVCCPCISFSVLCLAVAVGRDNDNYCCACFGWDFLECRQESNSCFE